MAEAKNGVWIDKDTGKVVRKQPTRGRQLVAPGKDVGKTEQAFIDRYETNYETAQAEQFTVETATTPAPKTTKKAG